MLNKKEEIEKNKQEKLSPDIIKKILEENSYNIIINESGEVIVSNSFDVVYYRDSEGLGKNLIYSSDLYDNVSLLITYHQFEDIFIPIISGVSNDDTWSCVYYISSKTTMDSKYCTPTEKKNIESLEFHFKRELATIGITLEEFINFLDNYSE